MRYLNLKYISIYFLILLILLLILYSHFIVFINFNNEIITIKLKIKLLFKLIRINLQLYPPKKKKNKKKGSLKDLKLLDGEIDNIFNLIKKIKVDEVYSDIYFGNDNPYITVYTTTVINGVYGNIINILPCKKLYLNITPNFTEDSIKGSIKLNIKFRLISMIKAVPIFLRIIRLKKLTKEGDLNDSN